MTLIIFSFKNGEQNMSYTILCKNHFYFLIKKKHVKFKTFHKAAVLYTWATAGGRQLRSI